MNAAVAFACAIALMLAGSGVAIFTGFIEPATEADQAVQVLKLRDLVLGTFAIGAVLVVWRMRRQDVE